MNRIADTIILMWGWRRWALALVAGALTALALPPFDIVPIAFLTVPVLVWLIDGAAAPEGAGIWRRIRPAAAVGWWFAFGFFAAGMWWIGVSFLVDADDFAWLLPFAMVALPAGLAVFWAVGAAVARLFWSDGWPRLLVFAVAMTVMEWLRGHALTGFPWNAFGYLLTPTPVLMQVASLVGLWGVTLLAFLVFAAPVLLASSGERGRGRFVTLGLIALVLVADTGFGLLRLRAATDDTVPGVRLRLVQAAIPEDLKLDAAAEAANFGRYLDLSAPATPVAATPETPAGPPTIVVWPETAEPYLLTRQVGPLAAIADMLPPGMTLVTGAPREEAGTLPGDPSRIMNSILVIDDAGAITDSYDKVHLVPFGEYLPLGGLLGALGLRQIVPTGFDAGLSRRTLTVPGAPPFAPLVCYEAIFPGDVTEPGVRPAWLLNVTNDAWYGMTPGPYQHFRQAVMRAVEEGLPLVRAANTGISAIVDAYGRNVDTLGLGDTGVVDGPLPVALAATPYARFGDAIAWVLLFLVAVAAGWGRFTMARLRD